MAPSRTTVRLLAAGTVLALAGCGASPNPPLISGASPAFTNSANAEPQSPNSLPLDAAGLQSSGPNSSSPNYLSTRFRAF